MKNLFLIFTLLIILFSCSSPTKESATATTVTSNKDFGSFLQQYHEDRLKLFPIDATFAGDNRYNHLLPNTLTQAYRKELTAFLTQYQKELANFDRNALSEEEQISYDILKWECEMGLEGLQFNTHLLPLNQFNSQHLTIGQFAGGTSAQPFATVKDYDNWLARLEAYTQWCDTALVNMQTGLKAGYVLPKTLVVKLIPQFQSLSQGPAKEHLFYSPIKNLPGTFSEEDKTRLTTAYAGIIENKIIPAHQKLSAYLQNTYLPAGRTTSGIGDLPDGKAHYQHLIRLYTNTNRTPEEVFALGQQEVARILQEMETVKTQVGFTGSLKEFFEHLRQRKELKPYTQPEQAIANFEQIHEKIKPNLSKLFDKTPKTAFEVKRTEAFREASASAEYNPGSVDGTRPGIFYVPVPDARKYDILSDEDLFLHEAIPGHHYQISLAQENTSLPEFRRIIWYSAYGEGWALYAESLGKELGLYTDPYQYFGMLGYDMHRAIRLVVDAGMHTQGWTREQAIKYSLDHEPESEAGIISEIERYMANPGQALSYKVGQLKISELRAKAEKEMGNKFRIGEFHNQVLESGGMPLNVLEQKINRWISKSKNT